MGDGTAVISVNGIKVGAMPLDQYGTSAINKRIREVMEVPAEGLVSITLKKDGVHGAR